MCGTLAPMTQHHPPPYGELVVNHTDPHPQTMLAPPRRARVRTRTYSGEDVTLELDVIAVSPGWVCVTQPRESSAPWNAWIPSRHATPL